jgi:hypothetical protein
MTASDGRRLFQVWARIAERHGWTVTASKSTGHLRWRSPSGGLVTTSGTPGGGRAVANARAQLRRLGLNI